MCSLGNSFSGQKLESSSYVCDAQSHEGQYPFKNTHSSQHEIGIPKVPLVYYTTDYLKIKIINKSTIK